MMGEPPVLAGGLKVTEAWPVPAVAVPMVGAAGTTALTLKVRLTVCAAAKLALPAWSGRAWLLRALTTSLGILLRLRVCSSYCLERVRSPRSLFGRLV